MTAGCGCKVALADAGNEFSGYTWSPCAWHNLILDSVRQGVTVLRGEPHALKDIRNAIPRAD